MPMQLIEGNSRSVRRKQAVLSSEDERTADRISALLRIYIYTMQGLQGLTNIGAGERSRNQHQHKMAIKGTIEKYYALTSSQQRHTCSYSVIPLVLQHDLPYLYSPPPLLDRDGMYDGADNKQPVGRLIDFGRALSAIIM